MDEAELKWRAKEVLRGIYWKAFLVSLVISFASGGSEEAAVQEDRGQTDIRVWQAVWLIPKLLP